jgi:putative aldouronate transport system substrate-binding protein
MKKVVVLFLTCFAAASVFAAGQRGGGASNPPITHPKYGELAYTEIDWYSHGQSQPDSQMVYDAMNEYIKPIINVRVNFHNLGSEYLTRAPVMLASGGNPGIYTYYSNLYYNLAVQGSYYALDEVLDKYGPSVKAGFTSAVWDAMRINGKINGIPSLKDNAYIFPMVYNDTMAQKLGVDVTRWPHTTQYYKLEPYFNELMEKRNQVYGNLEEPLINIGGGPYPWNFAVDSLTGFGNYLAVANFPEFIDIKGYPPETVFNLYGTQEYRDCCKAIVKMVKKNIIAIDYTGKEDWKYGGNMFAWNGWGYVYIPENLYGDKFVTKLHEADRYWTDSQNFTTAGNAFSANIPNAEQAMMFLDLLYSDSKLSTMERFGIEGVHYTTDFAGKMAFTPANNDPTARKYIQWYGGDNLLIAKGPEEMTGPDNIMMTKLKQINDEAVISLYFGLTLDPVSIANEIAACTNIIKEYDTTLTNGLANSEAEVDVLIDEFNAKLKANGLDRILAEAQRQADAFRAGKR